MGIAIGDPDLWGRGLGTDAVNAIVDFAFGELRMERVWLDTDANNRRAQAAHRKAGFTEEGWLRHAWFVDGRYADDIRMALLRDEWLGLSRLSSGVGNSWPWPSRPRTWSARRARIGKRELRQSFAERSRRPARRS